jgi:hypothetical protein
MRSQDPPWTKFSPELNESVTAIMIDGTSKGHTWSDIMTCMVYFLKITMGFNNKELSIIFDHKSHQNGARYHILKYKKLMSVKDKKIIAAMEFVLDKMCDLPNQPIFVSNKQTIAYDVGLGSNEIWPEIS